MRQNWALSAGMTVFVLAVWLVGAAVTKHSLEEMALFAPIAVVVGATVGLVVLWVKVVVDSLRRRREGASR